MKTFTVNKKQYEAKEFDFNMVCQLEDMGISLDEINKKQFSLIRSYFSICSGKNAEESAKEIEAHIVSGGSIKDIADAMTDAMNESSFFRALKENTEAENTEIPEEKSK